MKGSSLREARGTREYFVTPFLVDDVNNVYNVDYDNGDDDGDGNDDDDEHDVDGE